MSREDARAMMPDRCLRCHKPIVFVRGQTQAWQHVERDMSHAARLTRWSDGVFLR